MQLFYIISIGYYQTSKRNNFSFSRLINVYKQCSLIQSCQIPIYKTRSWPGDSCLKSGENSGDFYWNQEAFWLSFSEENWSFRLSEWLLFSPDKLIVATILCSILYYIYFTIIHKIHKMKQVKYTKKLNHKLSFILFVAL